ncbi:beta-ketoacyl-[acyl-carrier-protein] synthase family protein [Streptomyces sp. NBC_01218]|uniref:beta-ketoacyl-[acyl-carrier-protein] synthase family protein n=1 Tax=Streptomyces sp. NBC_01218 TaxID=2903780 RepID=UPI002E10C09F|nr:beta-ketoacyl-[acyl-carrier-protein] synthase family protein [Streptomyces sp. NBC_01218]
MRAGVVVTGLGLVTPGGIGVEAGWRAALAGVSTAARDPRLAGLRVDISCRVPEFDADALLGRRLARRMDRGTQLGVVAAREAFAMAGLADGDWDPARVGVVMGSGGSSVDGLLDICDRLAAGRPESVPPMALPRSLPSAGATEVALDLGAAGPNFATSAGCASGLTAIGVARDLLRSGALDIVVAGGAESLCHPLTVTAFAQLGVLSTRPGDPCDAARPFGRDRDGFVVAEGAGILVLERAAYARARRAPVLAHAAGYGAGSDAHHVAAVHPEGRGAERAVRAALADARWRPEDVEHVNAHGAATRANDAAEASWLARVLPHRPPVTATKATLGHAGAGSGGIEAALSVLTLSRRTIPPTANHTEPDTALAGGIDLVTRAPRAGGRRTALCVSTALGGQNSALALLAS